MSTDREAHRDRCEALVPELVAALQASLNWLASYPGGCAEKAYDRARAAIAKAEGKDTST